MALSIRDLIATILAAATAGILYVQAAGSNIPVLSSNRLSALLLLGLGIAMCSVGSQQETAESAKPKARTILMGTLGGLAFIAAAWALIAGSQFMVMALGVIILLMWLITTIRHAATAARQPA